ncbi:MAG: zf-HC2 domain-containing protein [Gemmatimonadota bacterium]|jgi:hypothetical protein
MSHVDEGTLHAYLDGALDAVLPADEAARVRRHLELCDECAARLEEERALRAEASHILGRAAPETRDLPPFEALLARAAAEPGESGPRVPKGRRLQRLAWAASVVLAVGAGWMLRSASAPRLGEPARQGAAASTERGTTEAPAPALTSGASQEMESEEAGRSTVEDEGPSGGVGARQAAAGAVAERREELPGASDATTADLAAAPRVAEKETAVAADTQKAAAPLILEPRPSVAAAGARPATPSPERALDSLALVLDSLSFPRTAEAARAATAQTEAKSAPGAFAPSPPSATQASAPASERAVLPVVDATRRGDTALTGNAATVADQKIGAAFLATSAEARSPRGETASLAVPGLVVVSVVRLDAGEVAGAVRVRQLLASGDTLEIVHLPPGVRPSALPPATDGENQRIVKRDDGWLVLRAPVSRDVLEEMARRLDSLR